jgi:DHA2 family multidrug resistance protein-like MFS transporter
MGAAATPLPSLWQDQADVLAARSHIHTKRLMRRHPPSGDPLGMNRETSIHGSATRVATIGVSRDAAVLGTLVLLASVASLDLTMANVALPAMGRAFNAPQSALSFVAVGYSLGLVASVLWLGALGDHYARKPILLAGTALAIPAALLAATAPTVEMPFLARLMGGLSAAMTLPTALALVAALWSGETRTRYIRICVVACCAAAALGPAASGLLLEHFGWGSVFLVTVPLAVLGLVLAVRLVPSHVEGADAADDIGGDLPVVLLSALALLVYADLMALVCHVYVIG